MFLMQPSDIPAPLLLDIIFQTQLFIDACTLDGKDMAVTESRRVLLILILYRQLSLPMSWRPVLDLMFLMQPSDIPAPLLLDIIFQTQLFIDACTLELPSKPQQQQF
jgi:hypothetical protein